MKKEEMEMMMTREMVPTSRESIKLLRKRSMLRKDSSILGR